MKRNGYIDVIKFVFAIMIAEFHLGSGLFLGGRLAVDGFLMITGYLMMISVERDKHPELNTGKSTVKFISRKFFALFPVLLPSALLASGIHAIMREYTFSDWLSRLPLLIFDVFPLRNAGFAGEYLVGISWYLSSMFIALAILYPFCRKFRDSFVLVACPLISFITYGVLSHYFGNLAVGANFFKETILNTGVMRALGGVSLGCLMYMIVKYLSTKDVTRGGRIIFTVAEILLFVYFLHTMNAHVLSAYDYLLVFVIFTFLIIGISGISYSSVLFSSSWSKPFGVASTLIVLNHYCYMLYLKKLLGSDFVKTPKAWIFVLVVAGASVISYILSLFIKLVMKKVSCIRFFKAEEVSKKE